MLQTYPEFNAAQLNDTAVKDMEWVQAFILGVRKIRSGYDIKPGKPLAVLLQNGNDEDRQRLSDYEIYLTSLAKLESITWLNAGDDAPESATSLVGEMKLLIPMAGLIDVAAEKQRLLKETEKKQQEYTRVEQKLQNPNFVDKAPANVVDNERNKLAEIKIAIEKLQEQLNKLEDL